jgi:hypothetical protein
MAYVACLGGGNMRGALAGSDGVVVAVLARIRGLAVVQRYDIGLPAGAGGMTPLTQVSGDRVCSRLISCVGAVMTCRAAVGGLVVRKWYD